MTIDKGQKTALVFGASGLIGGHCVRQLLAHPAYAEVHSFGRRPWEGPIAPQHRHHVVDFERPDDFAHLLAGQDLFWCMGTTMKKAGSQAAFRRVDYDYPLQVARLAQAQGVNQFLLVSSVGADAASPFFYLRTKGELEAALGQIGFWALHIFQPSLLLGERQEFRLGEALAGQLGRAMKALGSRFFKKYLPIEGQQVAAAMIEAAQGLRAGQQLYPAEQLHDMGLGKGLTHSR